MNEDPISPLARGRKRQRISLILTGLSLAAFILIFPGCDYVPLKPWHTQNLTEEFTTRKLRVVKTFEDYKRLEDRLFAELEREVYARTATGPGYELVRFSAGSAADPQSFPVNWNRTFELPASSPTGGVLLLHGMSDSPYSLRALGEALHRRNHWVIGLRLPGHGTAPSGLKSVVWEDAAAAVRLAVAHLAVQVGDKPIHLVGYSTGAPLALDFSLDALKGKTRPLPASLLLISPAVGIHPMAALTRFKNYLSIVPGLGGLAWLSIQPEFDPYKYNSFATNGGTQVHRLIRSVSRRIAALARSGELDNFPPTLVFKSTVDATVSTAAVVDNLLRPLGNHGHELVLFDINRYEAKRILLVSDPGPLTSRLMQDGDLPFAVTLITNESRNSLGVLARHKAPLSMDLSSEPLTLVWPAGVISLSHVALPFPPDDPLYGRRPPADDTVLFLGQMALQGERDLLQIPCDWLLRLRHNPYYGYLENRSLQWIEGVERP